MLNVLNRIAAIKPQEFVTPVPKAEKVTVHTFWQGIPYRFRLGRSKPGWWHVIPVDRSTVKQTEPAQAWEVGRYLSQLPRFYAIATVPVDESTWLVVPYNGADAAQRGWTEPKQVHLVGHSLRSLDVIVVRSLAGLLLYEDVDTRLSTSTLSDTYRDFAFSDFSIVKPQQDFMNAAYVAAEWIREVKRRESIKRIEEKAATLEEQARWQLEFMGATLLGMSQEKGGYLVKWLSPDGEQRTTIIRQDTRVQTAGICLTAHMNGQDVDTSSQHNLSSIVKVMEGHGSRWEDYDDDDDW